MATIDAGNSTCTTGLSKTLYDNFQESGNPLRMTSPPVDPSQLTSAQTQIKAIAYAIARAVATHVNSAIGIPEI
jgi:hypothetical protein